MVGESQTMRDCFELFGVDLVYIYNIVEMAATPPDQMKRQ